MSAPALAMHNASLEFAPGVGVFDLELDIPPGVILGMIGPSGCGKSSTVRLLLGLHRPTDGTVRTLGKDPAQFSAADRAKLGYIPQQFVLYPNLSVAENIHFVSSLYGLPAPVRRERLDELLEFVAMSDARNRLGRQLSGGMQRRLMLAGALMHDPLLLFADEPTAGIDPVLREEIWKKFRTLRDEGRTLLVTTQIVSEAVYCDYVAVMRKGRLLDVDTPENLRRKTIGGEIVSVTVDAEHSEACYRLLRRRYGKQHVVVPPDDNPASDTLRVTVPDAGAELPLILNLAENEAQATVLSASKEIPSYDEVFITMMQNDQAAQAAGERQG